MGKKNGARKAVLFLGVVVYALGVLVGIAFNLRVGYGYLELWSFWGDPEIIPYDYTANENEFSLAGFRCPQLLTPGETKNFSIRIKNQTDKQITPVIQILVSERERKDSYTRLKEEFTLNPGETKEFTQPLFADSSMIHYAIDVRILVALSRSVPASMTRQCPVFVEQLGNLKGTQILALVAIFTVVFSAAGIGLFWKYSSEEMKRNRRAVRYMTGFAGFVCIILLSNILKFYLLALLWMLLAILLSLAIFESDRIESIFK